MHIYTHYRSGFLGYVLPNWRDDYYANPSYQNIHLSLPELEDQVSCQPSSWAKRGGAPAVNAAVFFFRMRGVLGLSDYQIHWFSKFTEN